MLVKLEVCQRLWLQQHVNNVCGTTPTAKRGRQKLHTAGFQKLLWQMCKQTTTYLHVKQRKTNITHQLSTLLLYIQCLLYSTPCFDCHWPLRKVSRPFFSSPTIGLCLPSAESCEGTINYTFHVTLTFNYISLNGYRFLCTSCC